MKKYLSFIMAALFLSIVVFSNCGGGDDGGGDTNPLEEKAAELEGTAVLAGVTKPSDATDLGWVTSGSDGAFSITFTAGVDGGNYSTSNSRDANVWPESGTWTWNNTEGTQILRNDGVVIDLGVSRPNVSLAFTINEAASSVRAGVIEGAWEFEMTYSE